MGAFALTTSAHAAVFNVNTTVDANDGVCSVGHCTLREAIQAAQNNVGVDTINLPAGTYNLTLNAPCGGAFGTFALGEGLTINGAGQATVTFTLPTGLPPGFAGLTVDHAYLTADPLFTSIETVSNPVGIVLFP